MWGRLDQTIAVYLIFLCILILITPPYGDPAVVLWTSKIMSKTGFPYDPICSKYISKNSQGGEIQFCVRSPLYYSLLAFSDEYYKIVLIIFVSIFFALQIDLARSMGFSLTVYSLMFPPIYLLFSRTYVDSLTVILLTVLLVTLIKARRSNSKYYKIVLFLTSFLLMLTRESSIVLPLLLLLISLTTHNLKDKNILIAFLGWITGLLVYHLYLSLSGGLSYSDFQLHIPSLGEVYRAFMTVLTPVLPWEVSSEDIQAYLPLSRFINWFMPVVILVIHLLVIMILVPFIFSLIHVKDLDGVIVGWLIFGFLASAGLLFLKGDVDFFRHLGYLIPLTPLLSEKGLTEFKKHSKIGLKIVKVSYVMLFALYFVRTIRLYTSGYIFDPCEHLLKRPELYSIDIFYETACR